MQDYDTRLVCKLDCERTDILADIRSKLRSLSFELKLQTFVLLLLLLLLLDRHLNFLLKRRISSSI